nr:immunoglobulin heavy chain junction region [Macaca mulatta]MOV55919.1 immunoglobulin heavy chain junction region [Macaca mulatta]MOV56746.1 immunoglobulin heavy chain junction region [Macaca mulatta]MOV60276.1 immunoglobulin heavy chain junction region [Macaca mulatta]
CAKVGITYLYDTAYYENRFDVW